MIYIKTIHIVLTNVHLDCVTSNRNASRDESVEAGMNLWKPGMNLSKPVKNTTIML